MTINFQQIRSFLKHYFIAKRNGHGVHSPFAYAICEEVLYNKNYFYDFTSLNKIRRALLKNNNFISIEDYGAGSKTFTSSKRKVGIICKKGVSSQKQAEILYKLINFLNCSVILELGTSIGLTTLYLAHANKNGLVTTIDGSKNLIDFAKQQAKMHQISNIEFIDGNFDDVLPNLIEKTTSLDFYYIDGNHTYDATMRYFKLGLSKKNNNSVFIFDDIYWSKEMTKAWREIKKHSTVTLSIDTFHFGILFFKEEIKEKINLKLYL